jgi:hypothetical protein
MKPTDPAAQALSANLRGGAALEHARRITTASYGRGSATEAEGQAAAYVEARLAALALDEVQVQPFQGLRSIWIFLALAFGFGLMGHAAFWLLSIPLGGLPALAVSALAFLFGAYLLWRKFTFQDYPLRRSLPHAQSRNVTGVIPSAGAPHRTVVLIAHLDSHRQVVWFATDLLLKIYGLLTPLAVYGLVLAPLFYGLSLLPRLGWFAWVAVFLALIHFIAWFTGMTSDLGPFSPGANDNASAVGTVLALAERLKSEPLDHTEVRLAFTGCEETGCDGMLAFLETFGPELREALFIDFELVGIGERLVYLQSEGVARKRRIPEEVERLICAAGQDFGLEPLQVAGFGVFTEMGAAWERGYRGACLMAMRAGSPYLPEWHRDSDTPERLQPETLARVHALAWEILRAIDRAQD